MAEKLVEIKTGHGGQELPDRLYACANTAGEIVSYKVRWREEVEDGVSAQRSKSFNGARLGSLDRALAAALAYAEEVTAILKAKGVVARVDAVVAMTVDDVFRSWLVDYAVTLSRGYGDKAVRLWEGEVATRPFARVRLGRISADPSIIVRFQDALIAAGMTPQKRAEVLKLVRAVLRWGRKRHPNALTVDLSGVFDIPRHRRQRLAYAADAYGLERIIEAVLTRPARDDLLPLRDAAFVAAMEFTVAARPSEWLYSATWTNLHPGSLEIQRAGGSAAEENEVGLKTGARAALLLGNAQDRLAIYRAALEERWGPQPDEALVFQVLGPDGPVWIESGEGTDRVPLAWSKDDYDRWTARVWRPAREVAAQAPDAPQGLARMRFYDCRHTAISMALHSTLVMTAHGMNLQSLSAWSGHDVKTLQEYYAHIIARYLGTEPIDLERECAAARAKVEAEPFRPTDRPSPQRAPHRRNRSRRRTEVAPPRAAPSD